MSCATKPAHAPVMNPVLACVTPNTGNGMETSAKGNGFLL
jgi:hypothetical protein